MNRAMSDLHMVVLASVRFENASTIDEVARFTGVERERLAQILVDLEAAGMIERASEQ